MDFRALLCILLTLCAALGLGGPPSDRAIRVGDRLKVTCAEAPAVTRATTVSRHGAILLDYVGAVTVEGLTPDQAAARIAKLLRENGAVADATVTVAVLNAAEAPQPTPPAGIVVEGDAERPGTLAHRPGMRLSDVVRESRPLATADLRSVRIIRADGRESTVDLTRPDPTGDPELETGDRVVFASRVGGGRPQALPGTVPEATPETAPEPAPIRLVMVMGGVTRPGPVMFQVGLTARQAVEQAGGRSAIALGRLTVERGAETLVLDLAEEGKDIALLPDDRVVVQVAEGREFVSVMGGVRQEGYFVFTPGMRLGDAVRAAGGTQPGAGLTRVRIVRAADPKKPIVVDFEEIERGFAGDVPLVAGDRIEVPGRAGRRAIGLHTAVGVAAAWALLGR